MPVAAGDAELPLDVGGRQQLARDDLRGAGPARSARVSPSVRSRSAARASSQLARRSRARTARWRTARACPAGASDASCSARDGDLERRLRRALAVLRRVECVLDVVEVRRDHQALRRASSAPVPELRQAVEREVQLRRRAARAEVAHAVREAGFEMPGAEQPEQRARRDRHSKSTVPAASVSPLSSSTPDTRSPSSVMRATGLPVRIVAPRARAARGQRLGDGAHAACRQRRAGRCPPAWPLEPVQQREHGVVRARPEIRAEHRVERERALQQRRLEESPRPRRGC